MDQVTHGETQTFKKAGSLDLKADIYRRRHLPAKGTLVFLHGGALLLGERTDLPIDCVDFILSEGFHVVSFDYRTAPQTSSL